jgi:predicted RNase H-like HicB family nuclease/DNA-binding XRE family transcriptional regulator
MQYVAHIHREGSQWLADFPDAPGCQTFADSFEEIGAAAQEALEGWLEAHLELGRVPPKPTAHQTPRGAKQLSISVSPSVAVRLELRWARHDRGLTQGQLAKIAGMQQQMIAKLESPKSNPTLDSLLRVAGALKLEIGILRRSTEQTVSARKTTKPVVARHVAATKARKSAAKSVSATSLKRPH